MEQVKDMLIAAKQVFPIYGDAEHSCTISPDGTELRVNIMCEEYMKWMWVTLSDDEWKKPFQTMQQTKNQFQQYFLDKGIDKIT